jgi:hypothetical protein
MRGCPVCPRLSVYIDEQYRRTHAEPGEVLSMAEQCGACGDWHWRGDGWRLPAALERVRRRR